jgi:hypothetical protein
VNVNGANASLAVGNGKVYALADRFTVSLFAYDAVTLAVDTQVLLSNHTGPYSLTSSPCAVFWMGPEQLQPALRVYALQAGYQAPLLLTNGNRIVADATTLYWTDRSGAIGTIPMPN